jgi:uncharacterized membrane protein HdeD (DUF308 family)
MKNWLLLVVAGALLLVGGVLALANPLAATLTATAIAAWSFIFGGAIQLFAALRLEGASSKIWPALTGLAGIIVGIALFNNPFAGMISLTILVAMLFMVMGIAKLFLSFSLKNTPAFWPVLISGALSVVLAAMIFSNFPQSAIQVLGILLAIELISSGVSFIMLGLNGKSANS